MKTIITTVLSLILTTALFAGGPSFVVQENGDDYIMYLKIDDASNIEAIVIEGDYSVSGESSEMAVSFVSEDFAQEGVNYTPIQLLTNHYDYANYTVKVLNKEGFILEYPMVQVAMNDDIALN